MITLKGILMFDFMDYEREDDYVYNFVQDGKIVGELTVDARRPVEQALALRDEKYPGATVFANVNEYKNKEEVSEDVES